LGKGPKEKRVNLFGFQPLFSCSDPPGITAKNAEQAKHRAEKRKTVKETETSLTLIYAIAMVKNNKRSTDQNVRFHIRHHAKLGVKQLASTQHLVNSYAGCFRGYFSLIRHGSQLFF
jgi:hypothetical protein